MKRLNAVMKDSAAVHDLEHLAGMSKVTEQIGASMQVAEDSSKEYAVLLSMALDTEEKVKQPEGYVGKLRAFLAELQQQYATALGHYKSVTLEYVDARRAYAEAKEKLDKWYYNKAAEANAATSKAETELKTLQKSLEKERR